MSSHHPLQVALGHVRNATYQLMIGTDMDGLVLGLECLDLEALLNWDDIEPAVVPAEPSPIASLACARLELEAHPSQVPPAAWPVLHSLLRKLG